ncbi:MULTISPECIES: hypothetical protein [Gilliamella]|jgi:hypothetical protein|uniref:hypothetical protein n=1 Tax=Gilliamella TaxID=1193503 RepID=UPI00080DCB76|nr:MULTISPECIES: hypothetical protein [Gilliamella]MCO6557558.1 hypothetical protein [Gilliamella sp.]OCG77239.1 hypothetical protein A9G44_05430 [Gilliamella apicola]
MKKNVPQQKFNSIETSEISIDGYCKLEQAELITRLTLDSNLNKNDTLCAITCVHDLLRETINHVQ